jgi:hypothetical protein
MRKTSLHAAVLALFFTFGPFSAWAAYFGTPPLIVTDGGTGATTLTAHGVLVGEGTSAVVATAPVAGSILSQTTTGSDPAFTATPTLGVAGTTAGTLTLANAAASFSTTIQVAGTGTNTYNFNLPLTAGTSGQVLLSGGGAAAPMTWGTAPAALSTAAVASTATVTIAATNGLTSIINSGTPATVINLPTAVQTNGWRECVKDGTENFSTNVATIKSPTAGTIDGVAGATGISINQVHEEMCFISDGSNWFVE